VVEGHVRGKVLHVRLPGTGEHVGVGVHIVLLLRRIALDVENELLARLQGLRAPLLLQHRRDLGVIDVAAVARLVGRIQAVQHTIRFPGNTDGPHGHAVELAHERRREIRSILLELHLGLDANILEKPLHQLHGIRQVGAVATGGINLCLQTLRETRFGQQTPGLLGIVLIILGPGAELIDG
jgi:hypothetical protein